MLQREDPDITLHLDRSLLCTMFRTTTCCHRIWNRHVPKDKYLLAALCTFPLRAQKSQFFYGKVDLLAVLLRTTPHLLRNSGQRNQHFSGEKYIFWNMPRSRGGAGVVHLVTFANSILGSSGFKYIILLFTRMTPNGDHRVYISHWPKTVLGV